MFNHVPRLRAGNPVVTASAGPLSFLLDLLTGFGDALEQARQAAERMGKVGAGIQPSFAVMLLYEAGGL